MILTGQVRHRLQLLLPELGDGDALLLLVFGVGGHPLLVGVLHDLLEVLRLQRVEDVEEVLARRALAGGIRVGEVLHELRVLLEVRPERLHRELVVLWDVDLLDLGLLHQLLLADEDVLEEVLVDDVRVREVVLDCAGVRMRMQGYLRCLSR